MACIVITVSSPYHYAMKARKPQSPKREPAATSGMESAGASPSPIAAHFPFFPLPSPRPCPSQLLLLSARAITRLRLNTHDGQNLPLGMPAGIVCYLAGHI